MKVESIRIEGIGGIKDLTLDFNDHMNLICGPNGIGKTTVLECVAHTFSHAQTNILKRNIACQNGHFSAKVKINDEVIDSNVIIDDFDPDKKSNIRGLHQHAKFLLSLKVNRTFQYQLLNAVSKDILKEVHQIYEEAKTGVNITEVKNWFVNRFLYSAHKDALTEVQMHNLEIAKKCFSLLNEEFYFSKVLASSNEIMVGTPNGEIYYEYLSSGFKSCLSIIFGIIKDIEYRFKEPGVKVDEFDGVVLIDELELHLHPEWQARMSRILVEVFPNVQFIASTHSPHIIQAANPEEIIALESDGDQIYRRE